MIQEEDRVRHIEESEGDTRAQGMTEKKEVKYLPMVERAFAVTEGTERQGMSSRTPGGLKGTKRASQHGPTFSAIPANFVHVHVPFDIDDTLNDSTWIHNELTPYISPRTTMFDDLYAWCWWRSRSSLISLSVTGVNDAF